MTTAVLEPPAPTKWGPVAPPMYLSRIPEGTELANAYAGAALQRLDMTPQGEIVAGVLEAKKENGLPLYAETTVEIPRRATKTTSIQNVLLGRCLNIPGYQVVSTAQDGTRASEFLADLMDLIEDHATDIAELRNDEAAEAWEGDGDAPEYTLKQALMDLGIRQLYRSQGREQIRFANGSKWKAVPPEPAKLRGKGVHVVWFDEAGELDPATSGKLMAGALPMLDTKPDGQVIYSGTPGDSRAGGFWDALEAARAEPDRFGICDYCADEFADVDDEGLWWEIHPGLSCGLTTIDILRARRVKLGPEKFGMEYLCIWPVDSTSTALDLRKWDVTGRDPRIAPPEHAWAAAYDIDPSGNAAAFAVAWLDEHRNPHVQIMRHRGGGSGWTEDYAIRALAKFPRLQLAYDSIGQNVAVADALRAHRRVRSAQVIALTFKQIGAGTAILAKGTDSMGIIHGIHPGLDAAVRNSQWRESGGTRLFRSNGKEITTLRAAAAALALVNKAPDTGGQGASRRLPRARAL